MNRWFSPLFVFILALVFGMSALMLGAATQENAPAKKADSKAAPKCLGCHGSFDKIAAATANYETPSGEKTSPHKYVPHEDKKDIPECTNCHTPHPVPLQSKESVVKPNIEWCYTSCHHAQNLRPCKDCH